MAASVADYIQMQAACKMEPLLRVVWFWAGIGVLG